jgi:hypothetical protein
MLNAILFFVYGHVGIRIEHIVQEQDEEIRRVALAFGEELVNPVGLANGQFILLRQFIVKA